MRCLHFGGHGGSIVLAFGVHNSCTSFQKLYEVIITHFVSILQEFQTPLVHFLHAKKKIYNFLIIKKAAPRGCGNNGIISKTKAEVIKASAFSFL
jgi:hypothetical protein